jgi:hypothetical protein
VLLLASEPRENDHHVFAPLFLVLVLVVVSTKMMILDESKHIDGVRFPLSNAA